MGGTITPEDMQTILDSATVEIRESLKQNFKAKIVESVNWRLNEEVSEIAKKFIHDEIAPEIASALLENKPIILEMVIKATSEIGEILSQQIIADATKGLSQSWNRKKILEGLFQ